MNTQLINTDTGNKMPLVDVGVTSGNIELVTRNIDARLVDLIKTEISNTQLAIFGCVAWMTDPTVIKALSTLPSHILLQKEDFLRPDEDKRLHSPHQWKEIIKKNYSLLERKAFSQYNMPGVLAYINIATAWDTHLRVIGTTKQGDTIRPNMHHKFLVFTTYTLSEGYRDANFTPYLVWTGSYNPTANAKKSFENVLIVRDATIAQAYLEEYIQLTAISEGLDWSQNYVALS